MDLQKQSTSHIYIYIGAVRATPMKVQTLHNAEDYKIPPTDCHNVHSDWLYSINPKDRHLVKLELICNNYVFTWTSCMLLCQGLEDLLISKKSLVDEHALLM